MTPGVWQTNRFFLFLCLATLSAVLLLAGCGGKPPEGALILTQTPAGSSSAVGPQDVLDERYPAGSRVVIALPPLAAGKVRVLSEGMVAAGGPVVSPNGQRIFFVGKSQAGGVWQVYETSPSGGRPTAVTAMEGGAMDPAVLSSGDLVFSSPVPKTRAASKAEKIPALYVQSPKGAARRLTFGSTPAVEPTVLGDGRILFVSARASDNSAATPSLALFTVNNDGTEITAFALDHDGAPRVHRPRELPGGRIGFLAADADAGPLGTSAEVVRTARPFASRGKLFNFPNRCRSVEPAEQGEMLACLETGSGPGRAQGGSFAVFRIGANVTAPGQPLFDDPAHNNIEAVPLAARMNPMGHISAMVPTKTTGTILCLDANFTRQRGTNATPATPAVRVRVLTGNNPENAVNLGEVPLREDGSFMAEVPADTPLGFESLDANGRVLSHVAPSIWVRPGENRSCLGCHQPYNRSPRNVRPLAAFSEPVPLTGKLKTVAQQAPPYAKK